MISTQVLDLSTQNYFCLFPSPFYHTAEIVSHKILRSLTVYVPIICYPMNVQLIFCKLIFLFTFIYTFINALQQKLNCGGYYNQQLV